MAEDFRVREATAADIPALARMRAARQGNEAHWAERITGYMAGTHHPQEALPARIIYVAEASVNQQENLIMGLIAGHLTRRYHCAGELQWIDVLESHRSRGVATQLLQHLAHWFLQQDAQRICVNVLPENTVARNFYRKHGAVDLKAHWLVWLDITAAVRRND